MHVLNKLFGCAMSAAMAFSLAVGSANATTNFPERAVRVVVPTAAGGPTDVVSRVVAQELSKLWNQPVVVDNKPGGGSIIGSQIVSQATPDGYTLLGAFLSYVTNPSLFAKLPYDTEKDFTPVAKMVDMASVIVVPPDFPANDLKEFVEHARKNPGTVRWALGSIGSSEHIAGGMLQQRASIEFLAVPYQGAGKAMLDLLGGHADFKVESVGNAIPHIESGKLKAIAVTSPERSPQLPNVPTIAEQGYPGYGITAFVALIAPAGTPLEIVEKISSDTALVLSRPEAVEKMLGVGAVVNVLSPADSTRFFKEQAAQFDEVISKLGLKGSN